MSFLSYIIIIGELKSQKKHSDSWDSSNNSKSHPTSISATGSHSTLASVEEVSHPASGDEVDTASAGELRARYSVHQRPAKQRGQ